MNIEEKIEILKDVNPEAVVFTDYDYSTAFVGYSEDGRAIYDFEKMVEFLMINEGWTYEDSVEWIEYNTIRALPYAGAQGPIILYPFTE